MYVLVKRDGLMYDLPPSSYHGYHQTEQRLMNRLKEAAAEEIVRRLYKENIQSRPPVLKNKMAGS
jgi:hypothetical protein